MRTYEAIFIFRHDDETFNKGKSEVQEELKNAKIKILKETDMGLKTLAYQIQKVSQGHYINFEIEASPETLQPLDRTFRLKNEILKFVFFKKDE